MTAVANPFALKASQGAGSEIPPAGTHPAVLVAIVDLGTHPEEVTDQVTKVKKTLRLRKAMLVWELTGEPCAGLNRNHVTSKEYTLSFSSKSNLRKLVEGWRGKAFTPDEQFDLTKILGQPCMVSLSHKISGANNTYAKLESVAAVPKGMVVPPRKLPTVLYTIGEDSLPDQVWMPFAFIGGERKSAIDIIKASDEWKQLTSPAAAPPANDQPAATPPSGPAPVMTGTPADTVPF